MPVLRWRSNRLARGMAAALPFVDEFVEGHSLDALEHLTKVINNA